MPSIWRLWFDKTDGLQMTSSAQIRTTGLVVYALALTAIQGLVVDSGFTPNEKIIWLLNGVASLLFASRLLNPHFTPPADAATNGFVGFASLFAGSLSIKTRTDAFLIWSTAALCGAITLTALTVLIFRPPIGTEPPRWLRVAERTARGLGSPNVIFTIVILVAVWLFHREQAVESFSILAVWAVIICLHPVESLLSFLEWARGLPQPWDTNKIVGLVAAHQSPGIVLIRQTNDMPVERGAALVVADQHGPWMLGVALNYVGRDEGNLLRVLTVPLPATLGKFLQGNDLNAGQGVAIDLELSEEQRSEISAFEWINRLCGIVDNDTSLEFLQFEVIDDKGFAQGRLVEVRIGDNRQVLHQIIEGVTREEIVQQKNKYGYARAKARKIGTWDAEKESFQPVKWLPKINAPVFLREDEQIVSSPSAVGHFPGTSYEVGIDVDDAVTHNTAILGILGVGKSYLAIELVERMIADYVKVICLDLTNQYAKELESFVDNQYQTALVDELKAAGGKGAVHQNKEEGGSKKRFQQKVAEKLSAFLADERHDLCILNPAEFDVWQQTSNPFQGNASMASLTPSEITAIISDAAMKACQEKGMIDYGRLCIVYEEAHSLVPEWNSVAAEGDKAATAQTARAILQGRKYGLGCLLITQRTANVTKTILNQCNTIFAMRTFDDTGKDFLANYIGSDYASVLPTLEDRHAVYYGKASTCENPVLIRLNDRDQFLQTFREAHPPPNFQTAGEVEA